MKYLLPAVLWGVCVAAAFASGNAEGLSENARVEGFSYDRIESMAVEGGNIFSVFVTGSSGGGGGRIQDGRADGEIIMPENSPYTVKHRRYGERLVITVTGRSLVPPAGRYEIHLTVDSDAATDIATDTGEVMLSALGGITHVRTDTGRVAMADCYGEIDTITGTGRQEYTRTAGVLNAESDTGRIVVDDHEGEFHLWTDTGSIVGRKLLVTGDCTVRSDTGGIDLDLLNELDDFSFDIESDTGVIRIGEIRGRGDLRHGSGPIRIRGKTVTGDVIVR